MANAKPLTKAEVVAQLAATLSMTKKDAAEALDAFAALACKETKKKGAFVVPGFGKLVKVQRKARMGRNPATGEAIKIKAKTVVKFRIAKACKDAIL